MMKLNIQLFAGGTIPGTDDAKYCIMQVVWSATAGDSVSNKSSVTASVQVRKTNSVGSTGTFNGNVKINGTTINISKKFSPLGSSWKTVGSATIDVPHNSDGTKICNISAYLKQTGTTDMGGEYNANADVTLDTILRESTPTLSSSTVEMGSSVTIYTNRKSDSFTHTIRYVFGNASGTIATGVGASTTWTPALTLAQQIPSATSGSGTIYCDTYSSGTLIGTKSVGITLTVPASVKPSITIGTISETNATMQSLNWGVYVQNKSQLSIPITASGSQGSSITGTTTTVNGSSYSGTSVITGTINASGSVGISSTTTDSRGRQTSTSSSATFVAYSNPTITTATASRCLSDGTDSDEGTYLKYSFAGSISPVSNHNGHLFRIGYRQKGIGSYTYTNVDTSNYSINKSNIVLNLNLDTSKSYDIRFEANDTFTSTAIERVIDTGFDLMNFNASGKAMAIGKVSEAGANEELFEVGMNTTIDGKLQVNDNEIAIEEGQLVVSKDGIYNILENSYGFAHYTTNGGNGHWFNTNVKVQGNVYGGSSYNRQLAYKDETMPKTTYTGDFNNYIDNSFGSIDGISNHKPTNGAYGVYGTMIVQRLGQMDYCSQIATDVNTGLAYTRYKLNGTWKDWVGLNHTREITFTTGEWRMAFNPYGAGWRMDVPFSSPYGTRPTLSLTSCEYFGTAGWKSCTASIGWQDQTTCSLTFSGITDSETRSYMVLIRMAGTLKL